MTEELQTIRPGFQLPGTQPNLVPRCMRRSSTESASLCMCKVILQGFAVYQDPVRIR